MSSFFQTLPDIIVQFIHIANYLTANYIQINYFLYFSQPGKIASSPSIPKLKAAQLVNESFRVVHILLICKQ